MAAMTLEEAGALPPPGMHFRVLCLQSGVTVETDDGLSPHSVISCPPEAGCCQEDHDHEAVAAACPQAHAEPCGLGVDGCTVCHQLILHAKVMFLGSDS